MRDHRDDAIDQLSDAAYKAYDKKNYRGAYLAAREALTLALELLAEGDMR